MLLGASPLSSIPLASAGDGLTVVSALLSATGGITFSGSAAAGARRFMTASGGLTFAGSPFLSAKAYRSASGGIEFGGSPLLRVAGKPIVFVAMSESYVMRSEMVAFEFTSLNEHFTFRGNG